MKKYDKSEAISIVAACAKNYKQNLVDRCLLFVCTDKHKNIHTLETTFYASNFLHLTGLRLTDEAAMSATDFYMHCLEHSLSPSHFEFAEDGTTDLKLSVLPQLMAGNLSANEIGDFSGNRAKLYTEKLAGNTKACIGFIFSDLSGHYVPNTVLNIDIRDYIKNPLRIIATYRKKKDEPSYTELVYKAKKVDWSKINYPDSISYLTKPE